MIELKFIRDLCGTLDDFFDLQRFKLFPAWCLLLKKKELIANFICRFFIWFKTRTQRKATSTILNHHSSIKKNMHYAMRLTTQIARHFREIHFGKNWWATTAQGDHGTGRPQGSPLPTNHWVWFVFGVLPSVFILPIL